MVLTFFRIVKGHYFLYSLTSKYDALRGYFVLCNFYNYIMQNFKDIYIL